MGNTSGSTDAIDKALNPARNGLNDSVKKTTDDINKSNADIKQKIDDSNKKIGEQLQNNLAATKSKLDNSLQETKEKLDLNLALTKQTINYGALQDATGVLSTIASFTPFGILATEGINLATGGKSNEYIYKGQSYSQSLSMIPGGAFIQRVGNLSSNGEFGKKVSDNSFISMIDSINPFVDSNTKKLEEPTIKDTTNVTDTIQQTPDSPQPTDSSYSKYSQFNDTSTIQKDKDDNTDLYITLAIGGGMLLFFVVVNKVSQ